MADVSMTVGTDVAEMDFTPAFTAAEARQIEAVNDSTGKARRLALELLTTAARRQEVAQQIRAAGGEALAVPTDMMVPAQIDALLAKTLAAWRETYVYFKHEDEARGPEFARRFIELL